MFQTCPRTCPKTCPKACSKTCHLGQNLDLGPLALGWPMLQKACERNCTNLITWLQIWIWASWAWDGQCQHEAEGFQVCKNTKFCIELYAAGQQKGPRLNSDIFQLSTPRPQNQHQSLPEPFLTCPGHPQLSQKRLLGCMWM